MLGRVDGAVPHPAEHVVAAHRAQHHRQTQPAVVRHHDQHQQVGDAHLQQVQQRLDDVHPVQQRLPVRRGGWMWGEEEKKKAKKQKVQIKANCRPFRKDKSLASVCVCVCVDA